MSEDEDNQSKKRSFGETSPTLQVTGSPSPNKQPNTGGQKRPTSRFAPGGGRLAGINNNAQSRTTPSSNQKSPYFGSSGSGSSSPAGRLSSLSGSKPAVSAKPSSNTGSQSILNRYMSRMEAKPVQRSAQLPSGSTSPSGGLTLDQQDRFKQLSKVFPNADPVQIKNTVKKFGSYNDCANELARAKSKSVGQKLGQAKSSKVQVGKSSQSIAQRYGAAANGTSKRNVVSDDEEEEEDDMNLLKTARGGKPGRVESPSPPPANRKRLVKGDNVSTPPPTKPQKTSQPVQEEVYTSDSEAGYESEVDEEFETRLLGFLNNASLSDLADIASCTSEAAEKMIAARPFASTEAAQELRLTEAKPGSRKKPEGEKIVNDISSTLKGYEAVDSLIQKCEKVGKKIKRGIEAWGVSTLGENAEMNLTHVDKQDNDNEDEEAIEGMPKGGSNVAFFKQKPKLMASDVTLKGYQQVGINWMNLLYNNRLSCILADEMGLGKTCQVIAFLAHLQEQGNTRPHLVVVPSSTLENWLREFQRFCPTLKIEPYYGSQAERGELRDALIDSGSNFDVMVTTYNLASGSRDDHGFLRSRGFNVIVYDEGHLLKNSDSERFNKLMKLKADFRLLLTGTPLQNNLKELISLLSFILPEFFNARKDDLSLIFKHKALVKAAQNDRNPLLSEQRINKAKTMMTPFVLRRKKDQVLQNLPKKYHEVEFCEMGEGQAALYKEQLEAAQKRIEAKEAGERVKAVNLLMDLRKAAVHPLLFRKQYTDEILREMAKEIMNEPVYREANETYIFQDMQVMNDHELHMLCEKFSDSIGHRQLDEMEWMASAKVQHLAQILPEARAKGDRVLIFSQFTQVLDILERALSNLEMRFLRLDGSTAVDTRQDMIDTFYAETDITVFLLSTKAGGFGINLACANTVVIHDLSFNPHDDKQAEDRAHRVGQTREVKVIRMITKDTIDENILTLANTKLELDASVADENEQESKKHTQKNEAIIAQMLFNKGGSEAPSKEGTEEPKVEELQIKSESQTPAPSEEPSSTT